VLLFAGPDYGAKAHVENVVRRAGLSNRVVFAGTIDGPTKAAALAAADVFALPSYSEGFSSSVLEALAAGVPVVISEPCAFPRIADEVAGLVVPIEERSVASAVESLLSDRELREAMGERGKALAREYSWPSLAARMADRYRAVVDQRRAREGGGTAAASQYPPGRLEECRRRGWQGYFASAPSASVGRGRSWAILMTSRQTLAGWVP